MKTNHPLRSLFAGPLIAAVVTFLAVALARAADYQSAVLSDGPLAYYRFNDDTTRSPINKNSGSLGAAGNAINDLLVFKTGTLPTGVVHPFPGAIVGDGNRSEFFDFTTRTEIPFNAAFTEPGSVSGWQVAACGCRLRSGGFKQCNFDDLHRRRGNELDDLFRNRSRLRALHWGPRSF